MVVAIVDAAGRVELPAALRSELGIAPGDAVALESRDEGWLLRRAAPIPPLRYEGNVLVYDGEIDLTGGDDLKVLREERVKGLLDGARG